MKLRIGGLQNVVDKALHKEQEDQTINHFCVNSMSFTQPECHEIHWYGAPTGLIQTKLTQNVEVSMPFTAKAYQRIINMMSTYEKTEFNVYHVNDLERPYRFKGAFISSVEDVFLGDGYGEEPFIAMTITFDYFFHQSAQ